MAKGCGRPVVVSDTRSIISPQGHNPQGSKAKCRNLQHSLLLSAPLRSPCQTRCNLGRRTSSSAPLGTETAPYNSFSRLRPHLQSPQNPHQESETRPGPSGGLSQFLGVEGQIHRPMLVTIPGRRRTDT